MNACCNTPEEWRTVFGNASYEISSRGNIRSVARVSIDRNGKARRLKGVPRPSFVDRKGYRTVALACRALSYTYRVHHLVLDAFVGPRAEGQETRHLDSNPAHNCLSNIVWGTREENIGDRIAIKTHCNRRHLLVMPNLSAWSWARGSRKCLACHRAGAFIYNHRNDGAVYDYQAVADRYYAEIASGFLAVAA